jgi:hypothetical protein
MIERRRCVSVWFERNPQTGYYTKSKEQPTRCDFKTVPYELKVEPTQQYDIKLNAREIIRGKDKFKNGGYRFFTGLAPVVGCPQWYVGDHVEYVNGKKFSSTIIFHFSTCNSRLRVFYFSRFDKVTIIQRVRFAREMIPQLTPLLYGTNSN